jgi:hypothetical protein
LPTVVENALLMRGEGWFPLKTGKPNLEGARIALVIALHVIAVGLPMFATPIGAVDEDWYLHWAKRDWAFMHRWPADLGQFLKWLDARTKEALEEAGQRDDQA